MGVNFVSSLVAKLDTISLGGSLYVQYALLDRNASYYAAAHHNQSRKTWAPLPTYNGPSSTPNTTNLLAIATNVAIPLDSCRSTWPCIHGSENFCRATATQWPPRRGSRFLPKQVLDPSKTEGHSEEEQSLR